MSHREDRPMMHRSCASPRVDASPRVADGPRPESDRDYWARTWSTAWKASSLRLDFPRPATPEAERCRRQFALDAEVVRRLRALTNDGPFLAFTVVQAV